MASKVLDGAQVFEPTERWTISDAAEKLGGVPKIRELFIGFQQHLYDDKVVA